MHSLSKFQTRTPTSQMLPHGVGSLYSPSASFQSLLANISAAQHSAAHQANSKASLHSEFLTTSASVSPPLSPSVSSGNTTNGNSSPPDDLRTSSIAALRLKAREHELRLEMLRQNEHGDILS